MRLHCCRLTEHWANGTYDNPTPPFRSICEHLNLVDNDPEDIVPHLSDFPEMWSGKLILDAIEWLAYRGNYKTDLLASVYFGSLLGLLCVWWTKFESEGLQTQLLDLLKMVIRSGANVHHRDRHHKTALQALIWSCHPGHESALICQWLNLLVFCKVDVAQYIEEECRINPLPFDSYWQETTSKGGYHPRSYSCIRPRIISRCLLQARHISLDHTTYTNPNSSVVELLTEFELCPNIYIRPGYYCDTNPEFVTSHTEQTSSPKMKLVDIMLSKRIMYPIPEYCENDEEWRARLHEKHTANCLHDSRIEDVVEIVAQGQARGYLCKCDTVGDYVDIWPFNGHTHTLCNSGSKLGECLMFSGPSNWCKTHPCQFNHARFSRKQNKKTLKQMKRLGARGSLYRMPGAWVE